MLYILEQDKPR